MERKLAELKFIEKNGFIEVLCATIIHDGIPFIPEYINLVEIYCLVFQEAVPSRGVSQSGQSIGRTIRGVHRTVTGMNARQGKIREKPWNSMGKDAETEL